MIRMQNLLSFSFVEWTALFYMFVLAKYIKKMVDKDHGGLGLLLCSRPSSIDRGWKGPANFLYVGDFLFFLLYLGIVTVLATILLIPHWLISEYLGYYYQIFNTSIYAGFIWSLCSMSNAANRQIKELQKYVNDYKERVHELEKQLIEEFNSKKNPN